MSDSKVTYTGEIPMGFGEEVLKTIARIGVHHEVVGMLYLYNNTLEMYTLPEITAMNMACKLPGLNEIMRRAVTELDVLNELVAYRIETGNVEVLVAPTEDFAACVVHKVKKKKTKGKGKAHHHR